MIGRRMLPVLVVGVVLSGRAVAQSAGTPVRLRGTVEALTGDGLRLRLRDGSSVSARLAPAARVVWLVPARQSDIQPGSYVGTAAVPLPDGRLRALEMQVFPESMRGVGEGTREWDLPPGSSMTNGAVGSVVATEGRTITIVYKGGEKQVLVPEEVPVVTYEPTDRAALTAGANVIVNGRRDADGAIEATSVSVGKDGLIPPM